MELSQGEISILLVCPRTMFNDLCAQAFNRSNGFRVVATVGSAEEALQVARANHIHVALISANLKNVPLGGFKAMQLLQSAASGLKTIILLEHDEGHLATSAFRAGAMGVFSPNTDGFDQLCRCVRQVHAGQVWANSEQLRQLLDAFSRRVPVRVVSAGGVRLLTKREEEIVQLVQDGLTNREVASELKLSEHTVRNNLFRIFDKLGVSTRLELALYAINHSTAVVDPIAPGTDFRKLARPERPGNRQSASAD